MKIKEEGYTKDDTTYFYPNINQFINKKMRTSMNYFQYNGSFSTPPCKEEVMYFVMDVPIEISTE